MGQIQTSLSRSRRIDKPIDFGLNFESLESLAQKSAGMEIPAEQLSKPSALFKRSLPG
jgi:hypothetical protein